MIKNIYNFYRIGYIIELFVGTNRFKFASLFWAGWIYFSSCFVITRFQFADAVSSVTKGESDRATGFIEACWWIADRLYHAIEFAILAFLLLKGFEYCKRRPFVVIPIGFLYACSDEYHQGLVNVRAAHLYDVFVDLIGVSVVLWVFIRVQIKRDILAKAEY